MIFLFRNRDFLIFLSDCYTISQGGGPLSELDREDLRIFENLIEDEAALCGETHVHNYVELLFLQAGECELYIEEKIYKLHKNYMIIIPNGLKHKIHPGLLKCKILAIAIPLNYMNLPLAADFNNILYKRAVKLDIYEVKFVRTMFEKIKSEQELNDRYSSEIIKNLLLDFFVYFLRALKKDSAFEKEISLVDEITVYLLEHYGEDLNQKSVAQMFYVSRSYLSKIFKAKTGRGFNEYLNKIRIEQAKACLKTTALPVTEIAFNCGFNDSNYFSKIFKKTEGVSPLNYRNG